MQPNCSGSVLAVAVLCQGSRQTGPAYRSWGPLWWDGAPSAVASKACGKLVEGDGTVCWLGSK